MPARPPHAHDTTHLVEPGGQGPSRTITRAELAAIWAALRLGATKIMSDSAAALWLIRRAVNEPMTLKRHLHRPLLEAIVELIDKSPCTVHLLKCKAHTGVYGNEMADRAAKLAATTGGTVHCECAPHPFENMNWPCRRQDDGSSRHIGDLNKGLREAAKATCSLGAAPTDGMYVSAWRAVAPETLGELSNAFATSSAIKLSTKRTIWKARCGLIYNKKLEQRYTKQGDGRCPLCREPDGTRHIISGCRALTGLYTERHNEVGRLVLKAIRKGERGAEVVQHDVGSTTKLAGDGIVSACRRMVPASTLPDSALGGCERERLSRPDITLDTGPDTAPSRREVWALEIKICNDTDQTMQMSNAEKQHTALMTKLRAHAPRATLVPLMFGATGTIYSSTKDTLISLGVPRAAATQTLGKIHAALCRHTQSIVGTRRAMEGPHNKRFHPRVP